MRNQNIPSQVELPSSKALLRSTILAALVAGVVLLTVVLPAEYGIDPTGLGRALGLQQMGEIKNSLAAEAAEALAEEPLERSAPANAEVMPVKIEESAPAAPDGDSASPEIVNHEMQVTLAPNEGTEIKVALAKGKTVEYTWWTDGGRVNFDAHGDSKELQIDYHSYEKGVEEASEGVIEAAFAGHHGWFWRNRTGEAITITLQTSGEYTDIQRLE